MHDLTFSPALTKTLTMQVVIIGGGISGIATAIRLREFLGTKVDITVSAVFSRSRVFNPLGAHPSTR